MSTVPKVSLKETIVVDDNVTQLHQDKSRNCTHHTLNKVNEKKNASKDEDIKINDFGVKMPVAIVSSNFQFQFCDKNELNKRPLLLENTRNNIIRKKIKLDSELIPKLNTVAAESGGSNLVLSSSTDESEPSSNLNVESPILVNETGNKDKPKHSKNANDSQFCESDRISQVKNILSLKQVDPNDQTSSSDDRCNRNLTIFSDIIAAANAVEELKPNNSHHGNDSQLQKMEPDVSRYQEKHHRSQQMLFQSQIDGKENFNSTFTKANIQNSNAKLIDSSALVEKKNKRLLCQPVLNLKISSDANSELREQNKKNEICAPSVNASMVTDRVNSLLLAAAEASKESKDTSYDCGLQNSLVNKYAKACLSDYNYLLIQNIELYQADSNNPSSKVGLRCVHCAHINHHFTAASFFPSAISCLASGLGTISARHFFGEKCPTIPRDMVSELRMKKKTSAAQTRMTNKIGLDAYCREMAKQKFIQDSKEGGIFLSHKEVNTHKLLTCKSYNPPAPVCYTVRKERAIEDYKKKGRSSAFIPSILRNFWECQNCNKLPYLWRASGSIIFKHDTPLHSETEKHNAICRGSIPLRIPRSAVLEYSNDLQTSVLITWDKNSSLRKSGQTHSRSINNADSTHSIVSKTFGSIDRTLIYNEDKSYTTEFHYFNMMQLKMTRLTKAGGSRGACPIGFPGLKCIHCGVREFFYTSADHLRNSFSHIPSHLKECPHCPNKVKESIESLKLLRNKQKSLLKLGSHKSFIDTVWNRMHKEDPDEDALPDEESSISSDDTREERDNIEEVLKSPSTYLTSVDNTNKGGLVHPEDRLLTSNFVYLALRQVEPYNLTEKDVAQGRGSFEVGFPGLVCKYCKNSPGARKFFNRSAYHLRNAFTKIPDHLMICPGCPYEIKSCLASFKLTRALQESQLKRGSTILFIDRVWGRLIMLDKSKKPPPSSTNVVPYVSELVLPDDAHLVTEFTFFTMQQMIPCSLKMSGNGARSTFQVGYPGLECRHCAGHPSARRFFYRTSEILGGNYAHIPNHLMSCSKVPLEIKATLESKKEIHLKQKGNLSRGSQRLFFSRLWSRLHSGHNKIVNERE